MFCTATLGGQIIKIIYEKDNILIFTIRNIKGNKYEYYNIIAKDPTFINFIKGNMYKVFIYFNHPLYFTTKFIDTKWYILYISYLLFTMKFAYPLL